MANPITETIRRLLEEHGINARELADRAGLDENYLYSLMGGSRRWPEKSKIYDQIAEAFGNTDGVIHQAVNQMMADRLREELAKYETGDEAGEGED